MADWRFHLVTLPGGVWVDRDMPLQGAQIIEALSAPASISGRLPLGYRMILTPTGDRALVEWGAGIVAEQEGRDPVFAIVDDLSTDGDWLQIGAGGFTSYPTGMRWASPQYSTTDVDPLDVVRMLWERLQSYSNGDLGVVVDGTTSPVRLGKPEDPRLTVAKERHAYMKEQLAYTEDQAKGYAVLAENTRVATLALAGLPKEGVLILAVGAPSGEKRSKKNLWLVGNAEGISNVRTWNGKEWVDVASNKFDPITDSYFLYKNRLDSVTVSKTILTQTKKETSEAKSKVDELRDGEAVPYTLSWWETHDLGAVITGLADETPFEYREETVWAGDDALSHRLRIGYPELGARREDLRLEIGVNVTAPPPLTESAYASDVLVLGAGEGRAMVHATASGNPGRLRRTVVVEQKDKRRLADVQASARSALASLDAEWSFDSVQLVDHPMCPYGSFDVGDWLPMVGDAGWTQLDQWVRVLEIHVDCPTGGLSLKVGSS